jgi:hypothetical protein
VHNRSKYSDEQIGLMSEEEFLTKAPDQFKEGIEDPHKLMLQRLEHEKFERLEALKRLEALRTRRDALAATVAGKRTFLTALEVNQISCFKCVAGIAQTMWI